MGALSVVAVLVLFALAGPTRAVEGGPRGGDGSERLHYEWRLEGLSGVLSRLLGLLPTSGDSSMELRREGDGRLSVAFTATSDKAAADDYWKYEAVVDLSAWHSVSVVETLKYKEKQKRKSFELGGLGVIDVLSGLQRLRYEPPAESERRTLWSDGKVYPVRVTAVGLELRRLGDREVPVRHLSIRGVREKDERFWRSRADIWVTDDAAALPVEMIYHQALGRLRLVLVDEP